MSPIIRKIIGQHWTPIGVDPITDLDKWYCAISDSKSESYCTISQIKIELASTTTWNNNRDIHRPYSSTTDLTSTNDWQTRIFVYFIPSAGDGLARSICYMDPIPGMIDLIATILIIFSKPSIVKFSKMPMCRGKGYSISTSLTSQDISRYIINE